MKGFDLEDFYIGLHELEIDETSLNDFDIEFADDTDIETRYLKPRLVLIKNKFVKYENAEKLAKEVQINKNERIHCIVSGNFIFGDFIGAYLTNHNIKAKNMTINTLSLSADNVDMLQAMMELGYIDKLNLIVSHYFYQHNRNTIVKKIYDDLDNDKDNFNLAVASTHCKIVNFKTDDDKYIVIYGSANLRSSSNIEQFTIEENKELYDFYENINTKIIDKFNTINKAVRYQDMRKAIFEN